MAKKEVRSFGSFSTASAPYPKPSGIAFNRVVINSGYMVPNLNLIGHSQFHRVLLVVFIVGCFGVYMMRKGTGVSNVLSQAIFLETIRLVRLLQGRIRF